eukprot:8925772-Pyramimonas_sp.AAC.1
MDEEALGGDGTADHLNEPRADLLSGDPIFDGGTNSRACDHALAVGGEEERVGLAVVLGKLGEVGGPKLALGDGEAGADLVDLFSKSGTVALHFLLPALDMVDVVGLRRQALGERVDEAGHLLHQGSLGGSHRGLAEPVHVGNSG